jgi:hypothetical protein
MKSTITVKNLELDTSSIPASLSDSNLTIERDVHFMLAKVMNSKPVIPSSDSKYSPMQLFVKFRQVNPEKE